MDIETLKNRKKQLKLTFEALSEETGLPIGTLKGIFTGKIIAFLACFATIAFMIFAGVEGSLFEMIGDPEVIIFPLLYGVCGVLGALSVFVFEWWDGDFADGWRVVAGIVLGLFINVIMVIISIVAFFKLIIRGWDY